MALAALVYTVRVIRDALAIRQRELGDAEPETLQSMNQYGLLLQAMGRPLSRHAGPEASRAAAKSTPCPLPEGRDATDALVRRLHPGFGETERKGRDQMPQRMEPCAAMIPRNSASPRRRPIAGYPGCAPAAWSVRMS